MPRLEKWAGMQLGTVGGEDGLGRYAKPVHIRENDVLYALMKQCCPGYGLILDGTPSFADAEAIMLTLVNKNILQIYTLLMHLKLLERKGKSGGFDGSG